MPRQHLDRVSGRAETVGSRSNIVATVVLAVLV